MSESERSATARRDLVVAIILGLIAALVFFESTKPTQQHFDYTFRIAAALFFAACGALWGPAMTILSHEFRAAGRPAGRRRRSHESLRRGSARCGAALAGMLAEIGDVAA